MPLEEGHRLGPYRVHTLLGSGGMGEVYQAFDTRLGRTVALKVISPRLLGNAALQRRFEAEARAASILNHPAVVTVYDVGETDGLSWIAMEWVEGRTLRERLAGGPLPLAEAVSVGAQVASGLAAAHTKGVVHRDLKPENIMLTGEGRAKIVDFGLARRTLAETLESSATSAPTPAATVEGAILGTVGYMSPEQAAGKPADFRSDQFALGAVVYEALTGQKAFARPTAVETLSAILRETPTPIAALRADVPQAVQDVISRCLAKLPEDRFSDPHELSAVLEMAAADAGPSRRSSSAAWTAPTEVHPAAVPEPVPRKRMPLVLPIVLTAIVVLVAIFAWMRIGGSAKTIDSLAVLPFENATNDPDADYLADGVTESLIEQMSRIPSLKVMARTTVMRFRTTDPLEAGKTLGVGAILTGSIARRGDQLLVTAELVETASGARLWGETYDRPATDLLNVQDSIAWEIADGLQLQLTGEEKRSLASHGTRDAQAYELYLRARYLMQYDNEEDDFEARRLLIRALERDPRFVEAQHGLATLSIRSAGNGYSLPAEAWARADVETRKTLQIDPGYFGARVSMATRHWLFDWDWPAAEREFRQLSADPRLYSGLYYHPAAMFYWATGRPEQSVAIMERALRTDPANLESRVMLADFLSAAGRTDEALGAYEAIVAADPLEARPLFGRAEALRRRGEAQEAIETLREAYALAEEQHGVDALAGARTLEEFSAAQKRVARIRLEQLKELAQKRYVSPLERARLEIMAGDHEGAFISLERAVAERSPGLVFLKVDRAWDAARTDPRFGELVRRVGIP